MLVEPAPAGRMHGVVVRERARRATKETTCRARPHRVAPSLWPRHGAVLRESEMPFRPPPPPSTGQQRLAPCDFPRHSTATPAYASNVPRSHFWTTCRSPRRTPSASLTASGRMGPVRGPTAWTISRCDGPNHLGLWYNALPEHQMAPITSDSAPFRPVLFPPEQLPARAGRGGHQRAARRRGLLRRAGGL